MAKIVAMGECLIDMIPKNSENTEYFAKAGGAPANVCACVSKLGGRGYYFGKLSTDGFSDMLYNKMKESSVLLDYVLRDARYKTAIAVVTLTENGDRSFSFYRNNTADLMLDETEIKTEMLKQGDILHFCSVGLVESPSKRAHRKAVEFAKSVGALVSFDVNLRLGLFPDAGTCKSTVLEFLPFADILKVTDEELMFLTDMQNEKESVKILFDVAKSAKILFVTKGAEGSDVYDRNLNCISQKATKVNVVDTTGAGDCFIGSMLYQIEKGGFFSHAEEYKNYLEFSSVACGIVCEKKGAMEAMPTLLEVKERL